MRNLKVGDRLKATWNIVVLKRSGDFSFKDSIYDYRNGDKVIRAVTNLGFDENHNVVIKTDSAAKVLTGDKENVGNIVETKKSTLLFDNTIDYNWEKYGAKKLGKSM